MFVTPTLNTRTKYNTCYARFQHCTMTRATVHPAIGLTLYGYYILYNIAPYYKDYLLAGRPDKLLLGNGCLLL